MIETTRARVGPLFRLLSSSALLAALTTSLACSSLVSTESDDLLTPVDARALMLALRDLDVGEDEPFIEYLQRARASLAASDDPGAIRLARHIPDDARAIPDAGYRSALPALLAAYARGRGREARIDALAGLIRHQTVNAPDTAAPGRSPVFDAFESELSALTVRQGLVFDHVDHIAYEMRSKEKHHDEIGVLVHADVVPAGESGWTVPPFQGVLKDDRLYGRGALDDKGPLVAALFAIAALEKSEVPFIKGFRLVAGTSEETHWACIERYQEVRKMPRATLVADASFPVGVGEKGIATLRVTSPDDRVRATARTVSPGTPSGVTLVALDGGQVANQVPSNARAVLAARDEAALDALIEIARAHRERLHALVDDDGSLVVTASGRAAHSAEPEKGENAIAPLVAFLVETRALDDDACGAMLEVLHDAVLSSPHGAPLGVDGEHPRFTRTTVNLGRLVKRPDGRCEAHVNVRWPPPLTVDEVVARARTALTERARGTRAEGLTVDGGGLSPTLIDENTPLVRALQESYGLVTGHEARTRTVSGTTYAKAVPGSVTFGPAPEDDGDARMHGPDEYIGLEELDALVEMYAFALARLAL